MQKCVLLLPGASKAGLEAAQAYLSALRRGLERKNDCRQGFPAGLAMGEAIRDRRLDVPRSGRSGCLRRGGRSTRLQEPHGETGVSRPQIMVQSYLQ